MQSNRNFVLNLDHISEGRTAEHSGRDQLILKGKVFTHKQDHDAEQAPGSIINCLVIAIEKQSLIDFYNQMPGLDPNIDVDPHLNTYDQLLGFVEYLPWDPDNKYCAIVVSQAEGD